MITPISSLARQNSWLLESALVKDGSLKRLLSISVQSAVAWYLFGLALRDNFLRKVSPRRQHALEVGMLHVIHSAMWVGVIAKKLWRHELLGFSGLQAPLTASLGFVLHDVATLWVTALQNPLSLVHQVATFLGLASISCSDGVAFALPALMSTEIPTLCSAVLRFFAVTGAPPIVLMVTRMVWILSFVVTKLIILPGFLIQHWRQPQFHQPTMVGAKIALLLRAGITSSFLVSALRDLPGFLARRHSKEARDPLLGRAVRHTASTFMGASLFTAFMSLYFVGPIAIPFLVSGVLRGSRKQKMLAKSAAALLAADVFLPMPRYPSRFIWKVSNVLMKPILEYFQFKTVHSVPGTQSTDGTQMPGSAAFNKDGRYLLAVYPHGFFPVGLMLLNSHLTDAGFLPATLGASVLSKLPILGRLASFGGYVPATHENTLSCLRRAYPNNITMIVPGGIAEMFKVRPDCEVILADRRGFVRMAIDSGAELVPVYCFGNTRLYKVASGAVAAAFEQISRMLRTSIVPFSGVGGTLIPYAHPQAVAVGKSIKTEGRKVEDVADEYYAELRRLYATHRGLVRWEKRELYFDGEQPAVPETTSAEELTVGHLLFPSLSKL